MDVYNSLISRRSVRRFLSKEVDQSKIKKILEGAAFAPSGHNIQPWHVYVVTGDKKKKITDEIINSIENGEAKNFKQELEVFNLASSKQINDSFMDIEEMLLRVGYLLKHTSKAKISKFKNYVLRANTSMHELNVLRGIIHQINWFLNNSKKN